MTNLGFRIQTLPFLVNPQGRPVGVKTVMGDDVLLAFLSQDGRSFVDSMGNPFTPVIAPNIQKEAPVNGSTVIMSDTGLDGTLYIAPATTISALTLVLPTEANTRLGQIRRIATNKMITGLTITGGTLLSTVTSLSAGDCVSFLKIDANTWTRIV